MIKQNGKHMKDIGNEDAVSAALGELAVLCADVIAKKMKVDSTFFSSSDEALRVKEACGNSDVSEVLHQLKGFHGEPSPAKYIEKLELAMRSPERDITLKPAAESAVVVAGAPDAAKPLTLPDVVVDVKSKTVADKGGTAIGKPQAGKTGNLTGGKALKCIVKKLRPGGTDNDFLLTDAQFFENPEPKTASGVPGRAVVPVAKKVWKPSKAKESATGKFLKTAAPDHQPISSREDSTRLGAVEARLMELGKNLRLNYLETAKCLREIQDNNLYLGLYSSFSEYCEKRIGFSYRRARQLIDSVAVLEKLENMNPGSCLRLPENEAQLRTLAILEDPAQMAKAWEDAVSMTPVGKAPTRKIVQTAVTSAKTNVNIQSEVDATDASHDEIPVVNPSGSKAVVKRRKPESQAASMAERIFRVREKLLLLLLGYVPLNGSTEILDLAQTEDRPTADFIGGKLRAATCAADPHIEA